MMAYQEFIKINNDNLQMLSPENNITINDDVWKFKYKNTIHSVDFSNFSQSYTRFCQSINLIFAGVKIKVTLVEFAKVLCLSMMEGKVASYTVNHKCECIAQLFGYLKIKKVKCLLKHDLVGLYTHMLTQNASENGFVPRFSIPSFSTRLKVFDVNCIFDTMKKYGVDEFLLPNVSINNYKDALNVTCQKVMGMTLSDYKKGGSFNFLGLDIGRYYIDFCAETFEMHVAYATTCRLTLDSIQADVRNRINYQKDQNTKRVCADVLSGVPQKNMEWLSGNNISKKTVAKIRKRTLFLFCHYYNLVVQKTRVFKLEFINEIAIELGLPEYRFDNQEFIRSMLFSRYYGEQGKSRKMIVLEFMATLNSEEINFGVEEFDLITDKLSRISSLTTTTALKFCAIHYEECEKILPYYVFKEGACLRRLNNVLLGVESAGTTAFVAMTGWRASEFDFSLSNINISINQEILDSSYIPYRFHVSSTVPKTSNNTLLDREITLATYILAIQLAKLNLAKFTDPCLYYCLKNIKLIHGSKPSIQYRVERGWSGFCKYYRLFTDLDRLKILKRKKVLTKDELNKLGELSNIYDMNISRTQELQKIRDKLSTDLERYNFLKRSQGYSLKEQLELYQKGTMTAKNYALFEQHLSVKTKHALKTETIDFDLTTLRIIAAELLEGVVYPTAHALRHMWAESVLRRYRGDVGKFIRANFKHLNEGFFMAYLRDKETRSVYEIAQRNVTNSVVREHLLAIKDNKREYAGGFDSYLSKVTTFTNILSNEEYIKVAKTISEDRIVAIKPNAWATCFLRVGTESRAKCAEGGVPQRRNASPKLCLGCINADVSEGNFNGIVVYTRPEVEACRNSDLPAFIKMNCIEVLKPALTQVKKLRQNSGNSKYDNFIEHLEESIEIALQAISKDK